VQNSSGESGWSASHANALIRVRCTHASLSTGHVGDTCRIPRDRSIVAQVAMGRDRKPLFLVLPLPLVTSDVEDLRFGFSKLAAPAWFGSRNTHQVQLARFNRAMPRARPKAARANSAAGLALLQCLRREWPTLLRRRHPAFGAIISDTGDPLAPIARTAAAYTVGGLQAYCTIQSHDGPRRCPTRPVKSHQEWDSDVAVCRSSKYRVSTRTRYAWKPTTKPINARVAA
jgi:hypothetical protein